MSEMTVTEQAKHASEMNKNLFKVVEQAINGSSVSMSDVIAGLEFVKATCMLAHMGLINNDE